MIISCEFQAPQNPCFILLAALNLVSLFYHLIAASDRSESGGVWPMHADATQTPWMHFCEGQCGACVHITRSESTLCDHWLAHWKALIARRPNSREAQRPPPKLENIKTSVTAARYSRRLRLNRWPSRPLVALLLRLHEWQIYVHGQHAQAPRAAGPKKWEVPVWRWPTQNEGEPNKATGEPHVTRLKWPPYHWWLFSGFKIIFTYFYETNARKERNYDNRSARGVILSLSQIMSCLSFQAKFLEMRGNGVPENYGAADGVLGSENDFRMLLEHHVATWIW